MQWWPPQSNSKKSRTTVSEEDFTHNEMLVYCHSQVKWTGWWTLPCDGWVQYCLKFQPASFLGPTPSAIRQLFFVAILSDLLLVYRNHFTLAYLVMYVERGYETWIWIFEKYSDVNMNSQFGTSLTIKEARIRKWRHLQICAKNVRNPGAYMNCWEQCGNLIEFDLVWLSKGEERSGHITSRIYMFTVSNTPILD